MAWRFRAVYPEWFDSVQFPKDDAEAWNQATRALRGVRYDRERATPIRRHCRARGQNRPHRCTDELGRRLAGAAYRHEERQPRRDRRLRERGLCVPARRRARHAARPIRPTLEESRRFVELVNQHGGKAELLVLPDAGLVGNTQIPFADLDNVAVADLLSQFLREHGLDVR